VRQLKPGECRDLNDACGEWARGHECENNPDFMLGTEFAEPQVRTMMHEGRCVRDARERESGLAR
jgi:hypothetical protein